MKRLTRHLCATAALLSAACGPSIPSESGDAPANSNASTATSVAAASNPSQFSVAKLSPVSVELDRFFYDDGANLSVRLRVENGSLKGDLAPIALVSPTTGDLEVVTLKRSSEDASLYLPEKTVPLKVGTGPSQLDGSLTAARGELLYALYYPDYKAEGQLKGDALLAFDVGAVPGSKVVSAPQLLPQLATEDELQPPPGGKRIGTLLEKDGLPLQVPLDELIVYPARADDLKRLEARTGGKVVADDRLSVQSGDAPTAYLLRVDTSKVDTSRLPDLLAHIGFSTQLYASSDEMLRLLTLALELQLDGFQLSFNPKLQVNGAPAFRENGGTSPTGSHLFHSDFGVDKAWVRGAVFDADTRRVRVGIIDTGFSLNPDFRAGPSGTVPQCTVEGADFLDGLLRGVRCGDGVAEGPQTVGNSFFGGKSWHGNMVVATSGGVLNNGYGVAGVAGQVAEPTLYAMGLRSYAFEMGLAVRHMVETQSPSVINISAGYPCQLLTRLGNFGICSTSARAATCSVITAGLFTAASVVCASAALLASIPIVGPILAAPAITACGLANIAAATGSAACFNTLIAGDLKSNMQGGIRLAMERGIPVVVSATNQLGAESFEEPLRSLVRWDVMDTTQWDLIPCSLPDVICVGAADPSVSGHPVLHGGGSVVDFWAPVGPSYFAPPLDTVPSPPASHTRRGGHDGGSSAAAAYVSGLVALIQAHDVQLNQRTTTLPDRRAIPGLVRALLQRTAWPADATMGRGLLVNPRLAIQEAASSTVPDLAALGYDTLLNSNEPTLDSEATARNLGTVAVGASATATGTVHHIPGVGTSLPGVAGVSSLDEDWYRASVPTTSGAYTLRVELRWLRRFGRPALTGDGLRAEGATTTSGEEQAQVFATGLLSPGATRTFKVHAPGAADDNVYKVRVTVERSASSLLPDRFDLDDPAINPAESRPNNDLLARAPILGTTRADAFGETFQWQYFHIPSPIGGGSTPSRIIPLTGLTLPEGDQDYFRVQALPFGFPAGPRACLFVQAKPGVRVQVYHQRTITTTMGPLLVWMAEEEGDGLAQVRFAAGAAYAPLVIRTTNSVTGALVQYDLTVRYFDDYSGCD
ncbi:S8/S53 family peptidase [Myxococcaceae bacterium GXIMD 01537]